MCLHMPVIAARVIAARSHVARVVRRTIPSNVDVAKPVAVSRTSLTPVARTQAQTPTDEIASVRQFHPRVPGGQPIRW
jgi:hypothetical protein